MRFPIMSTVCLIAVCMLSLAAAADEPSWQGGVTVVEEAEELVEIPGGRDDNAVTQPRLELAKGQDDNTVKQDLAELKQMVRDLSVRMKSLEQMMQSRRLVQAGEPGQLRKVDELSRGAVNELGPQLVTIVYRIGDLEKPAPVVRHITSKIAPEHWRAAGGRGSIAADPITGDLIVQATRDVHDKISQWLTRVREARQAMRDAQKVLSDLEYESY